MKTIKMVIMILIAVLTLGSCKKDNNKETAAHKILGKWSVVSILLVTNVPDEKNISREGKTDEYIDFRNDGKVYTKIDLDKERPEQIDPYRFISDTEISIGDRREQDPTVFTIKKLTDRDLILDGIRAEDDEISKMTITLKK